MSGFIDLAWRLGSFRGGNLLPYTLDFAVRGFEAAWTAPNWTVTSGTAKNTPTEGDELVTNGTFNSNAANWANYFSNLSSVAGGIDGNALQVENASGFGYALQSVATPGWFIFRVAHKNRTGAVGLLGLGSTLGANDVLSGYATLNDANWTSRIVTASPLGANTFIRAGNSTNTAGHTTLYDSISLKLLSGIYAYRNFGQANAIVRAGWTIDEGRASGVYVRGDGTLNNCLIAVHRRLLTSHLIMLYQVVGGTVTRLISTAATYVAGAHVEIRVTGNTAQLFYNDVQVGTDQAINAALASNTNHGLFSTGGNSSCDAFFCDANA